MAVKNFNKIACLLLSLVLVLSLFSVGVLATDSSAAADAADTSAVDTDKVAEPEGTGATADGTDKAEGTGEAAPAETSGETGDDKDETENKSESKKESKKISTGTIVSIAITLVIVVIAVIYCIKNKEKVLKFFRECKSEIKKITWTPRNQVLKNTFVVIVVVIVAAIFVAILDLLFSTGIGLLGNL